MILFVRRNRTPEQTQRRAIQMKKNLTEMVFILDKSGSMAGLEADTIGGFNSMIERQKKNPAKR